MAPTHHLPGSPICIIPEDFLFMGDLFVWTQEDRKEIFGDPIDHWEVHIIVPDLSGNVRFVLGPQELLTPIISEKAFVGLGYGGWKQIVNTNPMPHTRLHLLFKYDTEDPFDLDAEDFMDLGEIFLKAVDEHGIKGGGFIITNNKRNVAFVMRFGPIEYNEGSVLHQHANIFVTHPEKQFDVTLSKDPKKTAEGFARMLVFEKVRTSTPVEQLSPDEQELVKDRLK